MYIEYGKLGCLSRCGWGTLVSGIYIGDTAWEQSRLWGVKQASIVLITWYGKIQHCVDTSEKDSNGTVICHVDGQNFSVNTRGGIVVHEIP